MDSTIVIYSYLKVTFINQHSGVLARLWCVWCYSLTRNAVVLVMRTLFVCGGFHWVTVKGKQASSKEAPILAVAPHSSYFDALSVVYLGAPTIVAKGETGYLPFFGSMSSSICLYSDFNLNICGSHLQINVYLLFLIKIQNSVSYMSGFLEGQNRTEL